MRKFVDYEDLMYEKWKCETGGKRIVGYSLLDFVDKKKFHLYTKTCVI